MPDGIIITHQMALALTEMEPNGYLIITNPRTGKRYAILREEDLKERLGESNQTREDVTDADQG